MIYIVTGYMRCGTSMMMAALTAGGLSPAFSEHRDRMNEQYGDEDYRPNPGGFYELARQEYRQPDFPRMYPGRLIKLLFPGLHRLSVYTPGYRVVFMRRDPEEIRQSYIGFFDPGATRRHLRIESVCANFEQLTGEAIEQLLNRRDVFSVDVFQYREVLGDPLSHFRQLRRGGWPIDPGRASSVIDPAQCRFRIEDLTVGI